MRAAALSARAPPAKALAGTRLVPAREAPRRRTSAARLRPAASGAALPLQVAPASPEPEQQQHPSGASVPPPAGGAPPAGAHPASPEAATQQQQKRRGPFFWLSDEWKEEQRKDWRLVFDEERWQQHRSSSRYWRHVAGMVQSAVVAGLAAPLLYVTAVSVAVGAYHTAAAAGLVPLWPALKVIASAPFNLTSFALSLLLVFRTNSSYARWDEARKMWGMIVNRSRDLVRQGLAYIPPWQTGLQAALCRWTVAFNRSLMCHLRPADNLRAELAGRLAPEELEALLAAKHRPNYCLQVLSAVVREAQLPGSANLDAGAAYRMGAYRLDENITQFSDVTGGCERLLRTPIPLSYTRHTSRFLMVWLTLLPCTLWDACGWFVIPVSAIVAFLLLGIEEIGVAIEEPFGILPLETLCATIEGNINELFAAHCGQGGERHRVQGFIRQAPGGSAAAPSPVPAAQQAQRAGVRLQAPLATQPLGKDEVSNVLLASLYTLMPSSGSTNGNGNGNGSHANGNTPVTNGASSPAA